MPNHSRLLIIILLLMVLAGCSESGHQEIILYSSEWECTKNHFQPIGMAVSWPCDQWTRKGAGDAKP